MKDYEIDYTERYGYSITFSEEIFDKLVALGNEDEDKFIDLKNEIRQIYRFANICAEGVDLEGFETLDELQIFDGEVVYPQEVIEAADQIMGVIKKYIS